MPPPSYSAPSPVLPSPPQACIRNADVGYGRVCPLCRKPFRPSDMRKACNAAEEADREKAKAAEAAASAVRGQFG